MFHLIDCDEDVLKVTGELFAAGGFQVQTFHSSTAYLEYVRRSDFKPPAAVITCYQIPFMNGYDMIAEIRKTYPRLKAVIISGSPEFDVTAKMDHLICRHLAKPYEFNELMNILKALNLCEELCGKDADNRFDTYCKFGIQHACPLYTGNAKP